MSDAMIPADGAGNHGGSADAATGSILTVIFIHFALLSLTAIGNGIVTLAPDMHRYVVDVHHWLNDRQFAAAYTIAQAAPGPNFLFVALIGWQIAGWAGAIVTMLSVVVPPTCVVMVVLNLSHRSSGSARNRRFANAMRIGLGPLAAGLLMASGWVLTRASDADWRAGVVTAITIAVMMRTKINPLWLIAAGAAIGIMGLI